MPATPKQLKIAGERYLAGESQAAIANDMGISESAIRGHIEQLGLWRPRVTALPEQSLRQAAERYLAGETLVVIANDFGVTKDTLAGQIKRLGVWRPRVSSGPSRKLSPEEEQIIVERYLIDRQTASDIALALGIGRTTVSRTLARCGVSTREDLIKHAPLTEEEIDLIVETCVSGGSYEEAAEILSVSRATIWRTLCRRGVRLGRTKPRTCTLDEKAFSVITPISARWMGFLFADGSLPKDRSGGQQAVALHISAKDRRHVEKFRLFLGSSHAISETLRGERVIAGRLTPASLQVHYRVRSDQIAADLIARGMIKEKGPERTPTVDLENLPAFWAGAIDGDGSIGMSEQRGATISLCGHRPLLEKFQRFLHKREITDASITPTTSGIWRIGAMGRAALRAIELLYADDSAAAGLDRKLLRAEQILHGDAIAPYEEGPIFALITET